MRLLDIFSRHPRGDISAHADGELAPARLDALEEHLAGCERCHAELDDLLAVRSALRDLPQAAAPRSFKLTPAMAEREREPVTPRATPAFVAMRVAGAGFAAVLAVVVMLDAGGIVDDSGGRSSDESSTVLFEADPTNRDIEATDGSAYGFDAPSAASGGDIPLNLAGTPPADDDSSLPSTGGIGGGIGDPYGSEGDLGTDNIDPALDPEPDDIRQVPTDVATTAGDIDDIAGDDAEAGVPDAGDGAAAAFTSEDDGISSLLVIEIGLAAIAALAIGGSFVMRRRAESE